MSDLIGDPNSEKSQRAMSAMMKMKKIDIAEIERAYNGEEAMAK
jgi:predicted 3-demethylubiquinone-9 3-methyltransferase (glyoxalase superfamily)